MQLWGAKTKTQGTADGLGEESFWCQQSVKVYGKQGSFWNWPSCFGLGCFKRWTTSIWKKKKHHFHLHLSKLGRLLHIPQISSTFFLVPGPRSMLQPSDLVHGTGALYARTHNPCTHADDHITPTRVVCPWTSLCARWRGRKYRRPFPLGLAVLRTATAFVPFRWSGAVLSLAQQVTTMHHPCSLQKVDIRLQQRRSSALPRWVVATQKD